MPWLATAHTASTQPFRISNARRVGRSSPCAETRKHSPDTVARVLWLLALGVDISALEEVFTVRELTIRTWLARSGVQSMKIHERFMVQLDLLHLQLDELWASVKFCGRDLWVWVVSDATTRLVPVLQVGSRSQEMAYRVVHELKRGLCSGSTPVFASDGLGHYFYALTAHFGQWEPGQGKKSVWVLLSQFAYAQVIKHQRRRRTVKVERRLL
jgi:transposase-like protein